MRKLFIILLLLVSSLFANIAKVTAIKGEVIIQRDSQKIFAKLGTIIEDNDIITTTKTGRAQIIFKDNTIISVGKSSTFSIENYLYEPKKPVSAKFNFGSGVFKTITGKIGKISPKKFQLKTKTSSIGIRGTIVGLESKNDVDTIIVPQGQVEVITPEGPVIVNAGQMVQSAVGVIPKVTSIPETTQAQMEQDSGATSNEQESGQGESTQTTALTQEEQEEAQEQQGAEEEEQKEEVKEEQKEESEESQEEQSEEQSEESSEESSEEGREEQSEESESTDSTPSESEPESEPEPSADPSDVPSEPEEPSIDEVDPDVEIDVEVEEPVVNVVVNVEEVTKKVEEAEGEAKKETEEEEEENKKLLVDTDGDGDIDENDGELELGDSLAVVDPIDEEDTTTFTLSEDGTTTETTPEATTETTTETTIETETVVDPYDSYTASMSGYHLIGVTGSATNIENFKFYGPSSLEVTSGGTFNLGPYLLDLLYNSETTQDSETISGIFTDKTFDISGAYTGHSDIGTLSFSKTFNSATHNLEYTIHADNAAEFIVGHTSDVTGTTNYSDLFYAGVSSDATPLSTSYIYKYAGYLGLSLDTTSDNVLISSNSNSNIEDLSSEAMYINPLTQSLHFAETGDRAYEGANSFNVGYLQSDGTILFGVIDLDTTETTISAAVGHLYGSDAQGIGAAELGATYTDFGLSGETLTKLKDGAHTYYQESKTAISTTGTSNFNGYINYLNSDSSPASYGSAFTLDINKDTGAISTPTSISIGGLTIALGGTTDALSSYYIDDDTFGVLATSASTDGTLNLIDDTGFLVTVPDSYNGGTYAKLDDESSWGYWTAKFGPGESTSSTTDVNSLSTWVAGIETATSYINSTQDGTFTGHVIGAVKNGSAMYPILFDANNQVSLTFSFGAGTGTFTGTLGFKDSNAQIWAVSVVSGTTSTTGFTSDASGTGGLTSTETVGGSNAINGKYFGTGEVKSVGGKFYFSTATQSATGVFKATK